MVDYIVNHWVEISALVLAVMKAADILADLTPTEVDNQIVAKVRKLLKLVALKNPNK